MRLAPAAAKINLFLHVGPPEANGYHPLSSWVVFTDTGAGDRLSLDFALPSDPPMTLDIGGPFGTGLSTGPDNLVWRAWAGFHDAYGPLPPVRIHLEKALPLAAGIGGGSSDAGTMLRLLRDQFRPDVSDEGLEPLAASLGADGIMCLHQQAAVVTGYGEILAPAPVLTGSLSDLAVVLINPGHPSPTGAVYGAYDAALSATGGSASAALPADLPERFDNLKDLVAVLETTRNDLERPAIALCPAIGKVLASLRRHPVTAFARMSGSGATCFALCETRKGAEALAVHLRELYPDGWVAVAGLKT
ncbi:MAG: 4-(cytidine 5'-diphospho)-2-C-methyl-D-erythritol kinase [Asticcacaulis sp.]